nr:family 16 glycoside hydrolase [Allorhodopirellula solitaria]
MPGIVVADDPSGAAAASADSEAVFHDDFESGLDRWEILDPATWKLSERDGNHTIEITARQSAYAPPVRSPLHVALIKDLELSDFEITFRVRSTKDTGNHRDCCVFFDYQDDQHFYYVHLGARPDPHSGQIMVVEEAPRLALTKNEKPTPWDSDWHQVKVVRDAESGKIQVYFDDMETPHMETTDKRFQSGRIGIGSFDDMNEFDDVTVRGH